HHLPSLTPAASLSFSATYASGHYRALPSLPTRRSSDLWVAPSSPRCWAVSSSDVAPVMVAIGAEFLLVGPAGERLVPAGRLYHNDGINYLTKQPDEILAEVRLPRTDGWDATYHKLRRRGPCHFPVPGAAA